MTAKQRNRKRVQRQHHQIASKWVFGRNYSEQRGLHAADLYIDVLFGRREGRIDA